MTTRAQSSDPGPLDEHFQQVYAELRRLAIQRVGAHETGRTLQATALVHEAYLRLVGNSQLEVQDRGHFFALAAQAMRWILLDRARKRYAGKRFHASEARTLAALPDASHIDLAEILSLDDSLSRLQEQDPRKAQVVMYRYFAGLSVEDTAEVVGISPATVKREWNFARAWLLRDMREDNP